MNSLFPIIFAGLLFVPLTWRSFAAASICKEVIEGRTTKEALFFIYFQGALFTGFPIYLANSVKINFPTGLVILALLATGLAHLYFGIKAGLKVMNK